MAAGAELNHWCFCQLMQIQCVGSAWVLASSPPTAECVFLSLSDSCACLRMEEGLTCVFLTLWPIPCFLRLFVCATRRFGSLSQAGVAHKQRAWHCGPHEALSAVRSLCCRFINTMQRTGINGDYYSGIERGSFGAWIINIFMRPFHSLCGVLCLLWPLAPSSSSRNRTRLRISDLHYVGCFGQRPVRRTQAIMYYSCGTIKILHLKGFWSDTCGVASVLPEKTTTTHKVHRSVTFLVKS